MLFLLALLLVCTQAAPAFTCNFVMREPSMTSGFVNGVMSYDYTNGWMLNKYTTSQNNDLFEYDPTTKAGKFIYKWSPTCSCTVLSLSTSLPDFSKAQAQAASGVTSITLGADGFPTAMTLSSGRTFTYSGCVAKTFTVATDFARPANCDCGAPMDVVVVLDRSCSISTTNFGNEKQFTQDFANGFTYSPTQVNLGLTNFHMQTWDGPILLKNGNSKSSVSAGVNALQCYPDAQCLVSSDRSSISSGTCCGCGTCISAGIISGADMLASVIPSEAGTIRQGSAKVLVVLTDGYHNKVTVLDSNGNPKRDARGKPYGKPHVVNGVTCNEDQTQTACATDLNNDLKYSVNYAQKVVPGVIIFAIGVGQVYSEAQLLLIAQGKANQVKATRDWSQLTGLVAGLISETCKSVPGTSCGATCCGFCSCGGTCAAPDGCDNKNLCTTTTVTGVCCKSTLLPPPGPPTCTLSDKCNTYGCDANLNGGKGGCTSVANPVQASTPCASYKCDPATGKTIFTDLCPCTIPCKVDTDCNSMKTACNTVKCVINPTDPCQNACQTTSTASSCNKGDLCKTYSCDPGTGCQETAKPVPPPTMCLSYSCSSPSGTIVQTPNPVCIACTAADISKCDDQNMCTKEGCAVDPVDPLKNYCTHTDTSASCNGGDLCKVYSCSKLTGCQSQPKTLPANTMCLTYSCDPKTGNPVATPVQSCIKCTATDITKCNDNNMCTTDGCVVDAGGDPLKNFCSHTDSSASCTGTDLCKVYSCDPAVGCTSVPKAIPAETTCLSYACDPKTGNPVATPKNGCIACTAADSSKCDDKDACTAESCAVHPSGDPLMNSCVYTDISSDCNGPDLCKRYYCDPIVKCKVEDKPVPADTQCQTFACVAGQMVPSPKDVCIDCTATNAATNCNDNNMCTLDLCTVDPVNPLNNKCAHTDTSASCNLGDPCKVYSCEPASGCKESPMPVPAETNCLTFACVAGKVVSTPKAACINCDATDTSKCVHDKCTSATCVVDATNPLNNACQFPVLPCPPTPQTDFCFIWSCDPLKGCSSTPVTVPPSNECFRYTCNPMNGEIMTENLHCSPPACTIDGDCDDKNFCTVDVCNWPNKKDNKTAVCEHTPVAEDFCDDKNACTFDVCVPATGCANTDNSTKCDDGSACTIDSCDPKANPKKESPCKYQEVTCTPKDVCNKIKCDILDGCQNIPFVCPNTDNCTYSGCYTREEADRANNEKGVRYGAPGSRLSGCYVEEAGNCTIVPVAGLVAGLAAGAVAGIVVAAVAAAALFSGASAYAFTASSGAGATASVANNPIYQESGNKGYSPLYKV